MINIKRLLGMLWQRIAPNVIFDPNDEFWGDFDDYEELCRSEKRYAR